MLIALPRVVALDATAVALLLPSVPRHSATAAAVVTSPCCATTAALTISRHDAAAHHVSKHVGLPLAVSRHRLAINGVATVHATLPHRLHAHILALSPVHVLPW